MPRTILSAVALSVVFCTCTASGALAGLFGPGPWFDRVWPYGNDTGGIIPYTPDVPRPVYHEMAASYCAYWRRLSHITSVHRQYGDYVTFVCIDRPGMIH
jgi:hypothetical protein